MLISLSWLKEFVDFELNAEDTAQLLCGLGLETEVKNDNLLDIEITPNRGDCLSVLGVAREIAAKLGKNLHLPKPKIKEESEDLAFDLRFSAKAKERTFRYTYRVVRDIKVQASPKWIQDKLISYGFRPINNIVDITNLVMIELGQPLHAFDFEKLGGTLFLRTAKKGESLITLDGKERKLSKDILVAEDKKGRLTDLCGIMGGFYSEVSENTKTIILQSAVFDPITIRLASKKLRHQTDASYRYERAVDFLITKLALDRATELILAASGGRALPAKDLVFREPQKEKIDFSLQQLNNLLGSSFSANEVGEILERLNFVVQKNGVNFSVQAPSYRWFDIKYWQDIAEEVLRVKGYDSLPSEALSSTTKPANPEFSFKEFFKDKLAALGFSETLSCSFISRQDKDIFSFSKPLKIKNPLSIENEYFRPVLLVNLLKQVAGNPWFSEVKFFEIGRVADKKGEAEHLIVLVAKKKGRKEIEKAQKELSSLGIKTKIEEVSQSILQKLKIKKPVFYLETALVPAKRKKVDFILPKIIKVKTPSSFPPAQIDLSFIVSCQVKAEEIEKTLGSHPRVILVELFDEFQSEKFGKNRKSVAFHLWLEHPKRALKEKEIVEIMESLAQDVEKKFTAQWRKG